MGRIVRSAGTVSKPTIGKATAQAADGDAEVGESRGGDNYLERIAKYIPAEIVAFFIFVNSILGDAIEKNITSSTPETYPALLSKALDTVTMAGIRVWMISWLVIILAFVMTPFYLLALRNPKDSHEHIGLNIIMAMAAFPVWAYAVDAVAFRPWHDGALASVIIAVFSVVSGAISPNLIASIRSSLKGKLPHEKL